jgi:hypothetical protein
MTKCTFIGLAALLLQNDGAAAFSSSRPSGVRSQAQQPDSRVSPLHYKEKPDDSPSHETDQIIYNDFQIRESEQPIKSSIDSIAEQPSAVEPGVKPAKRFVSPIQMIKLVPKVEPISNSSVFFVAPFVDLESGTSSPPSPPKQTNAMPKASNGMKEKWSPRKKWGTTAFQSTNYLESLSAPSASDTDPLAEDDFEDDTKAMMAALKQQEGVIRQSKLTEIQEAFRSATRRTSPREAIMNRIEKGEEMRKQKEIEKLEKLYVERQQRLDAKRRSEREVKMSVDRYVEERKRIERVLDAKESERAETYDDASVEDTTMQNESVKRGIPILGPFLFSSAKKPLLVGGSISLQYENLTPFQIKTIEVAQSLHSDHRAKMKHDDEIRSAGKEGGIEAAPIVAIIDEYTGSADPLVPKVKGKRFATLASVEIVERNGKPFTVHLMGVGRVFLYGYFSSKDAGLTREEEELNKLLQRIHNLEAPSDDPGVENEDHSVMMAQFDIFLDDSSLLSSPGKQADTSNHRASSVHAITELYRMANKVYRLHEERKKLLSGLRAGQARLNIRKMENEVIEYDDWNDLELCDSAEECLDDGINLGDYGFGTFGLFSTIPDLTIELMDRLEAYYSPDYREREEYEAEVASFVVLQVLEKYATPSELAVAMLAPSATERLDIAHDILSRHREELMVLVEKMSSDLRDCGEECTDLW